MARSTMDFAQHNTERVQATNWIRAIAGAEPQPKQGRFGWLETTGDRCNKGERGIPWRKLRGGSAATPT